MLPRFTLLLITLLLSSCASETLIQTVKEVAIVEGEARKTSKAPQTLIEEYESKMRLFDEDALRVYAPLHIKHANAQILKAKELLKQSNPESIEASKIETLFALRNVDKAINNKAAVKLHLNTADTHFDELIRLQSQILLPNKFDNISHEFSALIKLLEVGSVQDAIKDQPSLIKKMIELEIETLKKIHLEEAIYFIQKAKELDASSYARSSLKEAEELLQSAQNLIDKSYRDRNAILIHSDNLVRSAKKLYFIAKETYEIHQLSNEKIEQHIISDYNFLEKVQSILEISDIERQEYTVQQNALLEQLNILKSSQSTLKQEPEAVQKKATETDKEIVITSEEQAVIPEIIYSPETNKAVLPELFMPISYPTTDTQSEEDLEFDSIEIVK